jgi:hypothetical protein
VFVLYYACCVASSKQWTQFVLLVVFGHCQTGLVLNMPERPELRDVPRNTNLSSRALGAHVSEVKTEYSDILCGCVAAVFCVPTCCHPRRFVCASLQVFPRQMCPNNLEAVTSMCASLSVRALIPHRIYAFKGRVVGVG